MFAVGFFTIRFFTAGRFIVRHFFARLFAVILFVGEIVLAGLFTVRLRLFLIGLFCSTIMLSDFCFHHFEMVFLRQNFEWQAFSMDCLLFFSRRIFNSRIFSCEFVCLLTFGRILFFVWFLPSHSLPTYLKKYYFNNYNYNNLFAAAGFIAVLRHIFAVGTFLHVFSFVIIFFRSFFLPWSFGRRILCPHCCMNECKWCEWLQCFHLKNYRINLEFHIRNQSVKSHSLNLKKMFKT